jgi:hypothetical protein
MTTRVLFNGSVLVKPGGASRVDASLFASAGLAGQGVVAIVGEADGGEPDTVQIFSTPELARRAFRAGPLAKAAKLAFQPMNDARIPGGASALVCVKTNQSTRSALTLQGAGTANAQVIAANVAPYNLEPGQTVVVSVNGGADLTATFTATAAQRDAGGAGPYSNLVNGDVLSVITDSGNGGLVQDLTITGLSTRTAAEVAAILNPLVRGGYFVDNAGTLRFVSDTRGTAASVQVTGGTANASNKLNFPTTVVNGTGNVARIDAVTATEAATVIDAAVAGISVSGNPVILTNDTAGSGSLQVRAGTTALAFGFPQTVFSATTPVNVITFTSKDHGVHTNKLSVRVSDSGGGKVIEVAFDDAAKRTVETSNVLGATAEFTVQYTGNGSTAVMTITETQITTTISGQSDGSTNLTIPFDTYRTLQEVISFINAQTGYVATAVTSNPFTFNPANLDLVSAVSIRPTAYSAFARLFRCVEWVNDNSALVTAARVALGPTAPLATTIARFLAGGTRGTSTNTDWQDALDALGAVRVNAVAPLISENLANLGQGSTATFASVAAQVDAHAAFFSSTAGKSERQAYVGMKGTKSAVLAQAGVLNSFNTCLSAQRVTALNEANTLEELPEWAFAVMQAGGRAGAEPGEPLTFKFLRATAITQDASWNPLDDGNDMILGGVLYAESTPRGIRIVKGITTFTREDNNAYTEESVVMGWKNVAYELRTHLEVLFTGRKVSPQNLTSVRSEAIAKLSQLRAAGQIVDSVFPDGSRELAYRELEVSASLDIVNLSVVVSPVNGINFILNNIFLVPAQISA